MNIHISFKNMEASDALRAYAEEQSDKLLKFFRGRTTATWIFSVEKQNRVAHCHLVGRNMNLFAEGVSQDLYASIDIAMDKIERQIRKEKEIVKDHLHRHGHHSPTADHERGEFVETIDATTPIETPDESVA